MRFVVQLFGLSARCKQNPEALFERLSQLGYRMVEPCVAFGELGGFENVIWKEAEVDGYLPLLARYGLTIRSCHIFAPDLRAAAPRIAAFARRHGIRQLVTGCACEADAASRQAFAETCAILSDALVEAGAELLLHNTAEDIRRRAGDISLYEWLLDACGGKLLAQPDVGWLLAGGEDPEAFLWRKAALIRSLHYKDVTGAQATGDIGLGRGALDIAACYQFARAAGIPQIVDQDTDDGAMLDDLAQALRLLRECGSRRDRTASVLCLLDTQTGETRDLRRFEGIVEAPNWVRGEETLIYNADGRLYRYDLQADTVAPIETGLCDNCNNDHVLSPDGASVAVSHAPKGGWKSQVYIVPFGGSEPRLITPNNPSFLHGWSPDGEELAYCAFRGEETAPDVDVYAISVHGGEEKRLTHGEGFNDGPEYAPDGKSVWFNSTRSGLMQLWRMDRDGGRPRQMTATERNNWFAHLSPDGRRVAYISYARDELEPSEHLPNMNVELWLMDADGDHARCLLRLFGGQGSLNVNSWAADSRRLAYVRYELSHR